MSSIPQAGRKDAEAELRASEERLRAFVAASSDVVYRMSPDWSEMRELRGREFIEDTDADAPSRNWLERYIDPDDRPYVMAAIAAAIREKRTFQLEHRVRRVDGTLGWTFSRAIPLLDASGEIVEWFGAASDITARKHAEEALRENEERLRLFVEHAPAAIAMFDRDMRYLAVSRRFLSDYRLAPGSIIGRSHDEVFPDLPERWKEVHRRCLAGAVERSEEDAFPRADGSVDWVRWELHPWHDSAGEIGGIILFSEVVTERKRSMEALRQSEERFRTLVQGVKDCAIYMLAADGTVTSWSAGAEQIFGYGETEILGQHRAIFYTDEQQAAGAPGRELGEAAASGRCELESWRVRKDGSRFWANVLLTPLRDADGQLRGFANVTRDFTARRREEEELRASEARLRLAQEVARVGTFEWDLRTGVNTWTPEMEDLYGLPRGGFAGTETAWEQLVHPDDRAEAIRRVEAAFESGAPASGEWRVRWPDGSVHWIAGRWQVIKDGSGTPVRMTGINFDITDRKQAEELHASEAALRAADRQKNEFLAMLSHELRNPLAPIRNSLFILDHAAPGSDQVKRAQAVIDRQIAQLTWLIDDLLDVTRITRGKLRLERARVDLNELAHRAVEDQRTLFVKAGVRLELFPARTEAWVDGDRTRLAQAIGNLLQNAAKFTPRGGEAAVAVQAIRERREAILTVRDTGDGFDASMLPRLFQAFTQADATLDRSRGGLGLGLALVKGLVESHGGEVRAESDGPGKGAVFTMTLPLAPPTSRGAGAQAKMNDAVSPRRVLVIEDNEDAADTLREVLELGAHEVEVAYDGRQGIEKARRFRPDVVLCDIGLPEMDGYQVARALRSDPELGRVALVAVSGYAQPEDVAMAKEAGFDAHLAKPPSVDQLEAAIADARVLRRDPVVPG